METVLSPPLPFNYDVNSLDFTSGKTSESWEKWKKGFKIYFNACELGKKSPSIQVNILLHIVGEQCREILDQSNETTYEGLLTKLDNHFIKKRNITVERHTFFTRQQLENESIDQYVYHLKKFAQSCEFGNLNDDLIKDRLVCGVTSAAIRERLLREDELSLTKALEICRAAVASRVYSENIKKEESVYSLNEECKAGKNVCVVRNKRGTGVSTFTSGKQDGGMRWMEGDRGRRPYWQDRKPIQGPSAPATTMQRFHPRQCGKCGTTHQMYNCPAYGKMCSRCSRMNHFARVCGVHYVEESREQDSETSE